MLIVEKEVFLRAEVDVLRLPGLDGVGYGKASWPGWGGYGGDGKAVSAGRGTEDACGLRLPTAWELKAGPRPAQQGWLAVRPLPLAVARIQPTACARRGPPGLPRSPQKMCASPRPGSLRAPEPLLLRLPGLYSTAHRSPCPAQLRTQARQAPWVPQVRIPMGLGLPPRRPGVVSDDNLRMKNHRPIVQLRGPSPGASALVAPRNQTNKTGLLPSRGSIGSAAPATPTPHGDGTSVASSGPGRRPVSQADPGTLPQSNSENGAL